MRKTEKCLAWVVYRMEIHGKPIAGNAVCEQGEWDAMEIVSPGRRKLVQAGIASESEAESLARNSPLDADTKEISESGPPNLL